MLETIKLKELNLTVNLNAIACIEWDVDNSHIIHLTTAVDLHKEFVQAAMRSTMSETTTFVANGLQNAIKVSDAQDKKNLEEYFHFPHIH